MEIDCHMMYPCIVALIVSVSFSVYIMSRPHPVIWSTDGACVSETTKAAKDARNALNKLLSLLTRIGRGSGS